MGLATSLIALFTGSSVTSTEAAQAIADALEANDRVFSSATKGLVLKDTQSTPHYWRITISNAGALVITDAGTTKP